MLLSSGKIIQEAQGNPSLFYREQGIFGAVGHNKMPLPILPGFFYQILYQDAQLIDII